MNPPHPAITSRRLGGLLGAGALLLALLGGCAGGKESPMPHSANTTLATFAGGCFWCIRKIVF